MKTTKKKTKSKHYVDIPFVFNDIPYSAIFNYKCPQCGGEFNVPSMTEEHKFVCPFCGNKMVGYLGYCIL